MKKEYYYYVVVGIAVALNEVGLMYGVQFCTFPIAAFGLLWAALKFLSKEETQ